MATGKRQAARTAQAARGAIAFLHWPRTRPLIQDWFLDAMTHLRQAACAQPTRHTSYLEALATLAALGAGSPGAPIPANRAAADFVEHALSLFLRLRPAFECRRERRFQV